METIFEFTDNTDDELQVDVVPRLGVLVETEIMFTCYSHTSQEGVSVILPMSEVDRLVGLLRIELDANLNPHNPTEEN